MKFLTFLDYSVIESTGKDIQNQLSDKDREIQTLKYQMANLTTALYQGWNSEERLDLDCLVY